MEMLVRATWPVFHRTLMGITASKDLFYPLLVSYSPAIWMNKPTRILVVDDTVAVLQIFSRILRGRGYEVIEASTGGEGLRLAREKRPDLIVLDVVMPDISGIEVCRRIKSDPDLVDMFVILASGEALSVPEKIGGLATGADDYIAKPIIVDEFLARVRTMLRLRDTTAALRASEQHYKRLVEVLPDAVCLLDLEGRIVTSNQRAGEMLGCKSPIEMTGKRLADIIHPSDLDRFTTGMNETLKTGLTRNAEYLATRSDGTTFPIELSAVLSTDSLGKPTGLVIVCRDITERKWARKLLQAQKDFGVYLSSTNDLNDAMQRLLSIVLEFEGIDCGAVLMADPATEELHLVVHHGFNKSPITTPMDSTTERTGVQSNDALSKIRLDLKNEGLTAIEATPMRHGNRLVAVLVLGSHAKAQIPLRSWNAVEAIAAHAGDGIARVLTEQSLRANRQLLEKTLHSMRSAVFIVDAKSQLVQECNPSATRVFGYPREDLVGQRLTSLHVDQASEAAFMKIVAAAVASKGYLDGAEVTMKRKDGGLFPTEQSYMPIELENNQLAGWVTVVRDITDRKKAEKELRELPQRIIEAQESERLRVARELHDGVNQVIASAKMRLQKVQDSIVEANPATREMLARCYKMMVQALEENRRIAHNLRPSELDEFGLATACRNFCEQTQLRTSLSIQCSIPKSEERVARSVELNIFRILQEALANVERHAQATSVKVSLSFKGSAVTLKIQDDGCGFSPDAPRPNKPKHSGIGLTNMRERAAFMGGTCEFKSVPKQGTTITIHVPNATSTE